MDQTTYCGKCGAPIWNDWRGALHRCSRFLAVAFLSFAAALTAIFAVAQIGPSWYAICGACALFATFWLPVAPGRAVR